MNDPAIRLIKVALGNMVPGVWYTLEAEGYVPQTIFITAQKDDTTETMRDRAEASYRLWIIASDALEES